MDGLALVPYHPAELSRVEPSIDGRCKVPNHCTKCLTLGAQVLFKFLLCRFCECVVAKSPFRAQRNQSHLLTEGAVMSHHTRYEWEGVRSVDDHFCDLSQLISASHEPHGLKFIVGNSREE